MSASSSGLSTLAGLLSPASASNPFYPANYYASFTPATQTNVPAMGQRLQLKSSFDIPATGGKAEIALLLALKKHGDSFADNGGHFDISVTLDDHWLANAFSHIYSTGSTSFEMIKTTGLNEGPRSPGTPTAAAGPDQTTFVIQSAQLQGFVSATSPPKPN